MIYKKLKNIELSCNENERPQVLRIYGDNKFVKGEIFIHRNYFNSLDCVIKAIWKKPRIIYRKRK